MALSGHLCQLIRARVPEPSGVSHLFCRTNSSRLENGHILLLAIHYVTEGLFQGAQCRSYALLSSSDINLSIALRRKTWPLSGRS